MKVKDFELLKKMMNTTLSENDGEALNALRAANRIIAKSGTNWDAIFKRLVTVDIEEVEEEVAQPVSEREKHITHMFDVVLNHVDGSFRDFILSLHAQWERRKSLSPAQMEALTKSYNKANKNAHR